MTFLVGGSSEDMEFGASNCMFEFSTLMHIMLVLSDKHRWELPGNYPVFTVVMVIYHYVERIWRILVTPILIYNICYH